MYIFLTWRATTTCFDPC